MARMRRSTRNAPPPSPEPGSEHKPSDPRPVDVVHSPSTQNGSPAKAAKKAVVDDSCPACSQEVDFELNAVEKENWVRCDACKTWYHWRCAGDGGDLDMIDKWFCQACLAADASRVVTLKPPARKSSRKRTQRDYASLNSGMGSDPGRWIRVLEGKSIKHDSFKRMQGQDVSIEWLESDDNAMREPFIVERSEGLGMKMPPQDYTVDDVAEIVGPDTPVEVIDVASQSNSPGWTLGRWAAYYNTKPSERDKIRNVISLEISGTKLADQILPPRLVRELDWVEKYWPSSKRGNGHSYPKVQLYCLMGVATAWTDWHVDFAGSSVYYHVLRGSKIFYFIRPTPANLAAYERWSGTEIQSHQWLGDMVDEVVKVTLVAGNTMIIPTGWIHAVYTPMDTLVFGGNFLHSYNMKTQLKVRTIEINTGVPKKFRFPHFSRLCWYVGEKCLRDLKAKEEFSPRVLESIEALANFLVSEVRTMERGTEPAKREAKEQVPSDRVKDSAAMARELRWRAQIAAGHDSDDESKKRSASVNGHGTVNGASQKRRRISSEDAVDREADSFKNFKPRVWESVVETDEHENLKSRARRPDDGEDWTSEWLDWTEDARTTADGVDAEVDRRRDVVVKLRRTSRGLERQRVERIVEEWTWSDGSTVATASPMVSAASTVAAEDS